MKRTFNEVKGLYHCSILGLLLLMPNSRAMCADDLRIEAQKMGFAPNHVIAPIDALLSKLKKAYQSGDADLAIDLADRIAHDDQSTAVEMNLFKFNVLLFQKHDYASAYGLADRLIESDWKDNAGILYRVAGIVLEGKGIENRDVDLALKMAILADELSQHDNSGVLDTLARAYAANEMFENAIDAEFLAITKSSSEEERTSYKRALREYLQQIKRLKFR